MAWEGVSQLCKGDTVSAAQAGTDGAAAAAEAAAAAAEGRHAELG